MPFGYWEAKDEDDDLDEEIEKKFRKGYPQDNIIFEDSRDAVLIQNKQEVMRCARRRPGASWKSCSNCSSATSAPRSPNSARRSSSSRPTCPRCSKALRDMIEKAEARQRRLPQGGASSSSSTRRRRSIPASTAADVREMLIQHILTEEIFSQVFDKSDFHRQNNVAKELYALEGTFFTGELKQKHAGGPATLLRRHRAPPRSIVQPPREADISQGHLRELLQGLQPQGRRPARRRLHAERDRALHGRERRLAVPEAFRQDADRQERGDPRSRRRHRHLHLPS